MDRFNTFKAGEDQAGPVKLPCEPPSVLLALAQTGQPLSSVSKWGFTGFLSWTFWKDQFNAGFAFFTAIVSMFVAGMRSVNPGLPSNTLIAIIQWCVLLYPLVTMWLLMSRAAEFNARKVRHSPRAAARCAHSSREL